MSAINNPIIVIKGAEKGEETTLDFLQLKKAALILRALNHKLRLRIVQLINDEQKMTVTEIYIKLRIEQSVASQHLAILRRTNVVVTERDGKFIYYTLNNKRIDEIKSFVDELLR